MKVVCRYVVFFSLMIFSLVVEAKDYIVFPRTLVSNSTMSGLLMGVKGKVTKSFGYGNGLYLMSNLTSDEIRNLSVLMEIVEDQPVNASNSNWHMDRVDQLSLPLDGSYFGNGLSIGGVDVYILDTGIAREHLEFAENNVEFGANFAGDGIDTDCNGHGTHVASIVGGSTSGIAKRVKLIDVKVLGCFGGGTYGGVISAVDWVVQRASQTGRISLINMSLGGGYFQPMSDAVKAAFDAGVYVVVAAGNDNGDACYTSPAAAPEAITVGASDVGDIRAGFSNYGSCVDVYAPGVSVRGAVPGGGYESWSGTSMASPVSAGVLALYLARFGRVGYDTFQTKFASGVIQGNPGGTANKFVFADAALLVPPTTTSSATQPPTSSSVQPTTTTSATQPTTSCPIQTTTATATATRVTTTKTVTRTQRVHHPAPTCVSGDYVLVRGAFSKWGAETACGRLSRSLVQVNSNNQAAIAQAVYSCDGDTYAWVVQSLNDVRCHALQVSAQTSVLVQQPCTRRYPAVCGGEF